MDPFKDFLDYPDQRRQMKDMAQDLMHGQKCVRRRAWWTLWLLVRPRTPTPMEQHVGTLLYHVIDHLDYFDPRTQGTFQ